MSTFPRKRTSPARSRLAECHAARREAETKIAEVTASLERLAGHENEVAEAERSLAELDSAEASATLSWAKSGEGDAPAPNVDRREEISKALAVARAQAAAAVRARASLSAELNAATQPLSGINTWSNVSIISVVIEESATMMAALVDAIRNAEAKSERLLQVARYLQAHATNAADNPDAPGAREIMVANEMFLQDLARARQKHDAPLDAVAASHEALMQFVSDLKTDSTVALEVTP
jgi:hypothetical protein